MVQPLSVAGDTKDKMLPEKNLLEAKRVLESRDGETVVYPGAVHGFAVMGT